MNLLARIKTWALVALGFVTSVLSVLHYRNKAKHEQRERQRTEYMHKIERDANQAMVESLGYEAGIREQYDETIKRVDRTDID